MSVYEPLDGDMNGGGGRESGVGKSISRSPAHSQGHSPRQPQRRSLVGILHGDYNHEYVDPSSTTSITSDVDSISLKSTPSIIRHYYNVHKNHSNNAELAEPLTANSTSSPSPPNSYSNVNHNSNKTVMDPFYVFRDDLERKLQLMDESLAEYLRLVHHTDSSVNTAECKSAKKHLKRSIKNAESTLMDVQTAVSLEQQRLHQQESNHDDAHSNNNDNNNNKKQELQERQRLVETSHDRIERAKRDANSQSVQAKLLADERAMRRRRAQQQSQHDHVHAQGSSMQNKNNDSDLDTSETNRTSNSRYKNHDHNNNGNINNSHNPQIGDTGVANDDPTGDSSSGKTRTSLLLRHQDETLDELNVAVIRVGDMALMINDEVQEQNKMLDEMATDLDNAEEELGLVMGKLAKFLKTKDSWQLGTIVALSFTAFLLFFLVLYT